MSLDTAWPKITQSTTGDRVYHAIRDRILSTAVAPGAFIRELEICQGMGVSRTPVREALARLASEGFLERNPHRGYRVPDEPLGDLLHLYPVLSSLDLLAGRLAFPRLTDVDLARLKDINERLARARDRGDTRALIELNNEFHHLFAERSGNPHLCALLDDLRARVTRLEIWFYSFREQTDRSIEEHAAIIAAIEAGERKRALRILKGNMALTYDRLREKT